MNKRNISRYFSENGMFSHLPLSKAVAAMACVVVFLIATGVGIALTVVNAASSSSQPPSSTVLAAVTPSPSPSPAPTATPEPVALGMEVTAVQQSIGVTVMNQEQDTPVLGQSFEVVLEYTPPKGSEEKAGKETYTIDPETGTLLVQDAAVGDYTVSLVEAEGYVMPQPVTVQVEEKVEYKADIEGVKDQIMQADEVNEAAEDIGHAGHSGAGSGSGRDPMENLATPEPTEAPTPEPTATPTPAPTAEPTPAVNSYEFDGSKTEERTATVYQAVTKSENGKDYLLLADGSRSNYYVTKTATAPDGTVFLVEATLEEQVQATTPPASSTSDSASSESQTESESIQMQADSASVAARTSQATLLFYDEATQQGIAQPQFQLTEKQIVLETLYSGWYPSVEDKQAYYDPATHKKVTGEVVIAGIRHQFDESGNYIQVVATPEPTPQPTPEPTPEPTAEPTPAPTPAPSVWTKGIDVSKYQGVIDWNQVKQSGIEFAIIRVGYRGYGSGVLVEDSMFKRNIQGASAAGLKIGLYFYSQAVTEAEAVEEASMVLSLIRGYNIQYPIYFDTEKVAGATGRADTISRAQRTANAVAFCETIRNAGYRPGVYSYADWFYNQLNMANITKYSIWIAQYRDQLSFNYGYDIWQYSSRGRVPGITGDTDMNVSKLG